MECSGTEFTGRLPGYIHTVLHQGLVSCRGEPLGADSGVKFEQAN